MDTAQWPKHHQVVGLSRTMEEIATPNSSSNNNNGTNSRGGTPQNMQERRARPQKDQNLNCPRCNSTNTKFCYYNNYSLTQPRYFCKTCRRYWTQGGSLRNVPVGGGSRKNKRSSSSSSMLPSSSTTSSTMTGNPTMATTKLIPDLNPPTSLTHLLNASQNPKFLEGQDLNLAFPIQGIFQPLDHQLPKIEGNNNNNNTSNNENHEPVLNMNNGNINSTTTTTCTTTTTTTTTAPISALELLRTGIASRGSLNSYVPMPMPDSNTLYPSGFPHLQEFKPNMQPTHHHHHVFTSSSSSSGDHHQHHHHGSHDSSNMIGSGAARLLFPFADMNKLASSTTTNQHHENIHEDDQNKGGNDHHHHHNQNHHHHQGPSPGYWTGMLGGGTW